MKLVSYHPRGATSASLPSCARFRQRHPARRPLTASPSATASLAGARCPAGRERVRGPADPGHEPRRLEGDPRPAARSAFTATGADPDAGRRAPQAHGHGGARLRRPAGAPAPTAATVIVAVGGGVVGDTAGLRRRDLPARHAARPGADDAAGAGGQLDRRQGGREPPARQEPDRRVLPAARGRHRPGRARARCRGASSAPASTRS